MLRRSHHSRLSLVIAATLTVIGASPFNILPLLTVAAADTMHLSNRRVGILSLSMSIGAAASALLSGLWVRSADWSRAAFIGLGGMLVALVVTMVVREYVPFVLVAAAAGFCATAVFCLAMTILSDREQSSRGFGIATALQVAYQIGVLLAGPTLLRAAGLNAILILLALPAAAALSLAPLIPQHGRALGSEGSPKDLMKPATLIALAAFALYFMNIGAYWTYIELIGQSRGMSSRTVADSIAMALSAGVVGGVLAWVMGERIGRLRPLALAAVLTTVAALLLNRSSSVGIFAISSFLYVFAWDYAYAYQVAVVNAVDATGRGVAVMQAFGYLGVGSGAGLAALFVAPGDYHAVTWLEIVGASFSFVLFAVSVSMHTYERAPVAGS